MDGGVDQGPDRAGPLGSRDFDFALSEVVVGSGGHWGIWCQGEIYSKLGFNLFSVPHPLP